DLLVGWRLQPPVRCTRAACAGQEGLEPPTAGFGDRDSSQLSYCPVTARADMHWPLANHHQEKKCTSQRGTPSNCVGRGDYPPCPPRMPFARADLRPAVATVIAGEAPRTPGPGRQLAAPATFCMPFGRASLRPTLATGIGATPRALCALAGLPLVTAS